MNLIQLYNQLYIGTMTQQNNEHLQVVANELYHNSTTTSRVTKWQNVIVLKSTVFGYIFDNTNIVLKFGIHVYLDYNYSTHNPYYFKKISCVCLMDLVMM